MILAFPSLYICRTFHLFITNSPGILRLFINQADEFTYIISRRSHFAWAPWLARSFTGIQDERVSPHIYDERLNALAWCADTNPLPRGLSATYSSRYTARKIILVLKWRIILRDVFNDAPYTRFVPEMVRYTLVFYKRLFRKRLRECSPCLQRQ